MFLTVSGTRGSISENLFDMNPETAVRRESVPERPVIPDGLGRAIKIKSPRVTY